MGRLICRWVLIMLIMMLILGCDHNVLQPGEKIIAPQNQLIPVAGTWKVEKLLTLPGRVLSEQEKKQWREASSAFDGRAAVFGNESCLQPEYKIKRVNTRQYLAYNYKLKPQDLGLRASTVEVISITSNEQHFYDLIKIDQQRLVVYKNKAFYFLKRVNEKGMGEIIADDDLLRSGVLLGLSSPTGPQNYRTLWITARNRKLKPVVTLPNLIVPRKSGFWVAGVERQPAGDTLFAYPLANNIKTVNAVNKQQAGTANQRQAILFVGNDYIATAYGRAVNGETSVLTNLRILPTDNLTGNQAGVKISDVAGEAGKKVMLSSAAHYRLFVSKQKSAQLEATPQETNFTLVRRNGHWIMRGRLNMQRVREQQDFVDFNINMLPPPELVNYDKLCIPWVKVKEAVPAAIDAYTSPNRDIALIVSREAIYIYPIHGEQIKQQLLRKIPLQQGETVVMAEWATGPYAERWAEFISVLNGN